MGALSAFFLLSLLFLFSDPSDARKDPADYWKSMMKGEAMPESIQELVHQDPSSLSKDKVKKWHYSSSENIINMDHFRKDFDTRPNAIIYHNSHAEPKKVKPFFGNSKKTGHEMESEGEKLYVKPFKPMVKVPEYSKAQKEKIHAYIAD